MKKNLISELNKVLRNIRKQDLTIRKNSISTWEVYKKSAYG
jgi:hypothetical protein